MLFSSVSLIYVLGSITPRIDHSSLEKDWKVQTCDYLNWENCISLDSVLLYSNVQRNAQNNKLYHLPTMLPVV